MEEEFFRHCEENNLEGVNDCLSSGVDVNTTTHWLENSRLTGLMFACYFGHPAIVSRLVQVPGLDINYQDEDGKTAAHWAIELNECNTEIVRILAETGRVDWNKKDKWGSTPLFWALLYGHSDTVDIIVQQSNIDYNVKTECGNTLAYAAVWTRYDIRYKCVETLAAQERFDCWNVPYSNGYTPIMWALKRDWTEIVEILLRCPRVDLNCRNKEGWSLVFRAIQRNNLGEKF